MKTVGYMLMAAMALALASPVAAQDKTKDGPPRRPAADDVAAMLDVLREMEPGLAKDIDKWRKDSPERVAEMINRRFPRLRHMVELRRNDRDLYDLKIEDVRLSQKSLELVRSYRAASLAKDPKAGQIRDELRQSVATQFDVRQKIRQRELQRFEQRIAQMRKELDDRSAARERILEGELKKMLDQTEVKVEVKSEPKPESKDQ